jgi:hypothetical protein
MGPRTRGSAGQPCGARVGGRGLTRIESLSHCVIGSLGHFRDCEAPDGSTISAHDLKCKKKCVLVRQSKLIAFFEKGRGRWKDFYQKFPQAQGITLLSRVGFDEKSDRALVCEGTMTANLGGWGYFMLLERKMKASGPSRMKKWSGFRDVFPH